MQTKRPPELKPLIAAIPEVFFVHFIYSMGIEQCEGVYIQMESVGSLLRVLRYVPDFPESLRYFHPPVSILSLFTMQDLAHRFNFHPVHIIRCMKNSYHVTPIQALTTIRLEKSKELLLTTAMSVQDISEAVGFSSCSYFIKQFKTAYHTTPAQYRQEMRSHL